MKTHKIFDVCSESDRGAAIVVRSGATSRGFSPRPRGGLIDATTCISPPQRGRNIGASRQFGLKDVDRLSGGAIPLMGEGAAVLTTLSRKMGSVEAGELMAKGLTHPQSTSRCHWGCSLCSFLAD